MALDFYTEGVPIVKHVAFLRDTASISKDVLKINAGLLFHIDA
jgi:hypothetical protein